MSVLDFNKKATPVPPVILTGDEDGKEYAVQQAYVTGVSAQVIDAIAHAVVAKMTIALAQGLRSLSPAPVPSETEPADASLSDFSNA